MKIILIGAPFFTEKLEKLLNEYDNNKYIFLDLSNSNIDKLMYLIKILSADFIYFNSSYVCCSKAVSLALFFKKKIVFHWTGTDVTTAISRFNDNMHNNKYISNVIHKSAATWLIEELKGIGVDAGYLPDYVYEDFDKEILVPDKFVVLTYVGKGREIFYGIDTIIDLAIDFPDIEFRIAGISEYNFRNIPLNIDLLGWVDMKSEYENCVIYIRYPEHDGEPHSVKEALSYGKVVVYNRDYPFVEYVKNYDDILKVFSGVLHKFCNKNLAPNKEAIKYIELNYSNKKIVAKFQKIFTTKNV